MKIHLSRSDDIVVFGAGSIAGSCVEFLRKQTQGRIFVFEKEENHISILKKHISTMQGIFYSVIDNGSEEILLRIRPKIIFSIGSNYIFRKPLVDFYPIINYHNALLPKYPGRNAEAWTIFSQDRETGVTWHWVEETVDTGNIIMQRTIPLISDITSIKLLSLQARLAFNMFRELIEDMFAGRELPSRRQEHSGDIKYHYSWDRPNGGVLDMNWDFATISAFLRAMDYGKLFLLGRPVLAADDLFYTWRRYSVKPDESSTREFIDLKEDRCVIAKKKGIIELQGLEII